MRISDWSSDVCSSDLAATNLLQRAYRPVLEPLGLTYSQYLVMLLLWEHEPASVGELGERLHLDTATMTPLLKRMERAGLVSRTREPQDERRVLIGLTSTGRALREQALDVPLTLSGPFDIDPASLDDMRGAVQEMVRTLSRKGG